MAARRVPFAELEAVFLDAGNTLLCWDYAYLADVLSHAGIACAPEALERAEHAARPALSRAVASGASTEATSPWIGYVSSILAQAAPSFSERASLDRVQAITRILGALRTPEGQDRLWSRVPAGVPEALDVLRRGGLRLLVVSNSDGTAEAKLARAGLRGLVDGVVDSRVVGSEKPDRGIFDHALALARCAPERVLHVGDLYDVDVAGARAAGLHALLLDPFGDWDEADCERARDVAEVSRLILASRAAA